MHVVALHRSAQIVGAHLSGRHFSCGHYDLDTGASRTDHIVWIDYRKSNRTSVWARSSSSIIALRLSVLVGARHTLPVSVLTN